MIPFEFIRTIQRERDGMGAFNMDKPLKYYVVDITGKKHLVKSGATPNSFLKEETCRMIRVSHITGKPMAKLAE